MAVSTDVRGIYNSVAVVSRGTATPQFSESYEIGVYTEQSLALVQVVKGSLLTKSRSITVIEFVISPGSDSLGHSVLTRFLLFITSVPILSR